MNCVELSPSCKPPSKRSTSELRHATTKSSSKQLNFGESSAQANISVKRCKVRVEPLDHAMTNVLN